MPRNVTKLDKKDKELLYLLNENCRLTQTQLSKKVHLSRELVKYRLAKLVREKYILGFNLVVSNKKLHFETYNITVKLQSATNELLQEIGDFIKNHPNIKYLDRCSGSWDFIMTVVVKDKIGLAIFLDELNEKFGEIIAENFLLMSVVPLKHEKLNFLVDVDYKSKEMEKFTGGIVPDARDKKILQVLSDKANMSIAELARKTKMNPETCSVRFNNLIRKGIVRKGKAIVNYDKFNLQQYVLLLKVNRLSREKRKKLSYFFKTQKNILYAERILGNFDLKVVIVAGDQKEFDEQFTELRAYLKQDIQQYSFSLVLENIKRLSYPEGMW